MKCFFLDAGLQYYGGHHPSTGHAIVGEMQLRGIATAVYGYQDVDPKLRTGLGVIPFFAQHTYTNPAGVDPVCPWLSSFFTAAESFRDDLAALPDIAPGDLLFFNSVNAAQMKGLLDWLHALPVERLPRVVVEIGHEPGLNRLQGAGHLRYRVRPPEQDPSACLFRVGTARVREAVQRTMMVATFDPQCSAVWAAVLQRHVRTLPLPFSASGTRERKSGDARTGAPRAATKRVAFLGMQRPDKGYALAGAIIEKLLRRSDVEIFVHNSGPHLMRVEHDAVCAIAARDQRVRIHEWAVVGDQWTNLIDASDVIVLPYCPMRYHLAYSALAIEACARGTPFVAPDDTTLARLIRDGEGAGTVFPVQTVDAICAAIDRVLDRAVEYHASAARAADAWSRRHGPEKLADELLAFTACPQGTFAPIPPATATSPLSVVVG